MMGDVSRGAVLALLVLAADCGGESQRRGDPVTDGTTESLPPVPLEGFGVATADALCQYYARCSPWIDSWGGGCRAVQGDMLRNGLQARVERGIARGTVRYDPEVAATCLAALAALDCAAARSASSRLCSDGLKALDGTVQSDGECIDDIECAGDAYCAGLDDEACTGRCEPRRTVGESCSGDKIDCVFGAECLPEPGGYVCRLRGGEGQLCPDSRCQGSLTCGADGRCMRAKPVALGQECDSAHLCPADAACAYDPGQDDVLSHCVEQAPPGGFCTDSGPDMCPDGEWCKPTDGNMGTCTPLDAEGRACNSITDCNEYWGPCVNGACTAYRDIGAACSVDEQCWTYACRAGTCVLDTCSADDAP